MLNEHVEKLLLLKRSVGENMFAIGGVLKEIKDEKLYKEQYDTFEEFLGDPEVSFCRATAYKAMRVYEVYGSRMLDVAGIDTDKLALLADNVQAEPTKADELIEDARVLSRSDLRKKYGKRQVKGQSLNKKIEQFIDDMFPGDRRKDFIREVITEWHNWK